MLDLVKTPFSYMGSYMALAGYEKGKSYRRGAGTHLSAGVYLKSVKAKSRSNSEVMKFIPQIDGKDASYRIQYGFSEVRFAGESYTVKICFIDESRIMVYGKGQGLSLVLDCLPQSMYDYAFELKDEKEPYLVVNSYKSQTKYFISSDRPLALHQRYAQDMQGTCESRIEVSGDEFYLVIQDIPTHLNGRIPTEYVYEPYREKAEKTFEEYMSRFAAAPKEYGDMYREAVYTTWSATVKPEGLLKRPATYMSNTFFPGVWSWDHCFNSIALQDADRKLAYDNMMVVFDFQDEWGQLPGSVNDSNIHWNFAKPPIHGLFIDKMLKNGAIEKTHFEEIYEKLDKQVHYWLTYHDCNQDGIPEYHHGNDSGFDNSTVFIRGFIVDSPDLTAYLIRALDTLVSIGNSLGKDISGLREEKEHLVQLFLEHFVTDEGLVARDTISQEPIVSDSILPYLSLIIGEYLPEKLVKQMIRSLKEEFLTEYGLATEKVTSPYYDPDGYWRGPIWAPEMVILIDALEELGETEFAGLLTERFLKVMNREGFYENFNAVSGKGLRDTAHTWTSSSFIYLIEKSASDRK